ncbi:MAG TPA: hypothetical protein VEV16_05305 [Daejeonella sp.]|nr:hypothetical protein [Daejeonella sp.]
MSSINSNIIRIFVLFITCLALSRAQAQLAPESIQVSFLKDTVIQNGNAFSFNRVSLTNTSSVKQVFGLELILPEGWQSLFDNRKVYQLEPAQTLEIPLRIAAAHNTLSNKPYSISLAVNMVGNNKKNTFNYLALVQANSKWKSSLISPETMLNRINKETYFQIALSNNGNITEELSLNFNTNLNLTISKRNTRIQLPAGADTVIQVGIITDSRYLEEFKPQEIEIEIFDAAKHQQRLVQRIYSTNTIFRENPSRWYTMPLSVELVSQNFTNRQQQLYYINSSGNVPLSNTRSFSFNFRSDDFSSSSSGSGRYANMDYISKQWKISVGDQTEFSNFLINGTGARLIYTGKGYRFNALGVKSRIGDANQFSLNQELSTGKNKVLINKSELNLDKLNKTNSLTNILEYDLAFGKASNLAIYSGLGLESVQLPQEKINQNGYTAGLNYNYSSSVFNLRSTNNLTSKSFPGMERGVSRSSNEIRLVAKSFFGGAIADYTQRSVSTLDSNQFIYLFGGKSSEYGIRTGFNRRRNNLALTASVVNQLQDSSTSMQFRSHKLNLNTGLGIFENLNLSLSANLSRNFLADNANFNPVYSFNTFGTLQTKALGLSFRLDKGPFYYAELLSYLNTGTKTNRYQLSPYADLNFFKSILNTRVEVNYSNDIASNYKIYSARVDLNVDLKKQGLSLRFYGSQNFSQNNTNYLNLSVRKNFTLPLPGLQKYRSLKVVLFKDHNNNNVFDEGDEAIPNADIRIQNQPFITNKNGEIFYKNIKTDKYSLELEKTNSLKGWIAKNGTRQTLNLEEKANWYIPFQQSRFLSGRLNMVKDPFSKQTFNPANIRITAIDSKGETYSTLTDYDGNFSLNLPADQYIIKINEKVFTEEFRVLQDTFTADLMESREADVTFEIRERKRQINIRKPSGE